MTTSYPSVYKAQAVAVRPGSVDVFVPQVFGDTLVTVTDATGSLPDAPGMGWVFFQGGNAEFPVWSGVGVGGGTNEVFIGSDEPVDTSELWYDIDAVPVVPPPLQASQVVFTPTGTVAANNVQAAIAEVASEALQANVTVPWVALGPLLVNGWVNYAAPYGPCYYRKTGDMVELRGLTQSGTVGSVVCTLPVGYRPLYEAIFLMACYATPSPGSAEMRISTSGTVTIVGGPGAPTWLSLTGIRFSTT